MAVTNNMVYCAFERSKVTRDVSGTIDVTFYFRTRFGKVIKFNIMKDQELVTNPQEIIMRYFPHKILTGCSTCQAQGNLLSQCVHNMIHNTYVNNDKLYYQCAMGHYSRVDENLKMIMPCQTIYNIKLEMKNGYFTFIHIIRKLVQRNLGGEFICTHTCDYCDHDIILAVHSGNETPQEVPSQYLFGLATNIDFGIDNKTLVHRMIYVICPECNEYMEISSEHNDLECVSTGINSDVDE
jgi:hypothetical protein